MLDKFDKVAWSTMGGLGGLHLTLQGEATSLFVLAVTATASTCSRHPFFCNVWRSFVCLQTMSRIAALWSMLALDHENIFHFVVMLCNVMLCYALPMLCYAMPSYVVQIYS